MILTFKLKHEQNYDCLIKKAFEVAEFTVKNKINKQTRSPPSLDGG